MTWYWDIWKRGGDLRFDSNTLSSLQVISPGVSWAIMYIEANIMTQVVGEEGVDSLV